MKTLNPAKKILLILTAPAWLLPTGLYMIAAVVWHTHLRVRFLLWKYQADIETVINAFLHEKYNSTGIAKEPEQLIKYCKGKGMSAKRFNRVLAFCVEMDIVQDQPVGTGKKKFMYILNSMYLQ